MEVSATINKYEIMPLIKHHGKTNSRPFVIGGVTHPPGSLVYVTFSGVHIGGQKYAGVHKFAAKPQKAPASVLDFETLAGLAPAKTKKAVS